MQNDRPKITERLPWAALGESYNESRASLGRMGAAIGQRLNERGCRVVAWDRDPKARELQGKRGLRVVNGPQAVADEAEVVLSIITEDKGVRIFTAPDGFLSGEVKGKLFVEMSTLQPMTHRDLAPMVKAKGASLVEFSGDGIDPDRARGQARSRCSAGRPPTSSARARARPSHPPHRAYRPQRRRLRHEARGQSRHGGLSAVACRGDVPRRVGGLALDQMLDIFGEAPTASPWLKGKVGVLKGEPGDITLDIRTMRKDVMSAIATGARNGVAMPATSGTLASLSAAVAGGWGERDLAEVPRYFREFMLQVYQ